jgi:hypothetical protein
MKTQPGESYEYFIEQYKELHNTRYTSGYKISPLYGTRDTVKPVLEKYNCKTVLDFGCAKAAQWKEGNLQEYFELDEVVLYDPAIEEYSEYPSGTFDAVICTDVMEHIPEDSVDYVIEQVLDKATKLVIFRIAISESQAVLPDGQNAHVTVQNSPWWRERIAKFKRDGLAIEVNRVIV